MLCFLPRVQWWALLEKLMKDKCKSVERSQRKGMGRGLERWWLK